MAEMSWSNLKTEGNGELTQTLKLQQGQNQMRLVSLPYECHVHWEDTVEGAHKRVVCSGTGCPICNAGHTPQKRFQVLVIDRVDGKVKVLEDTENTYVTGGKTFFDVNLQKGSLSYRLSDFNIRYDNAKAPIYIKTNIDALAENGLEYTSMATLIYQD